MADIKFYANIIGSTGGTDGELISHAAGSGLGFYGSTFGVSVPVGSQQTTTYVTNALGTNQGSRLHNTAMSTTGSSSVKGTVIVDGATAINLDVLPNYLCPLNIRFSHSSPVKVQNCKLRIFDRNNIANHASGVATYVFEARHPSTLQVLNSQPVTNLSHRGRTDNSWYEFDASGSMSDMIFTSSPGASGKNSNTSDVNSPNLGHLTTDGPTHQSTRHDWYLALSSEPVTIGSKTQYGLYFTAE
jgi:hypothetical protein